MPSHEDVMQNINKIVGDGAGMPLPAKIEAFLKARYHKWIGDKKEGMSTSPLDVWDTEAGLAIQRRLREVGKTLKAKDASLALTQKDFDGCCLQVESTSECPHCPDPPPIGN